jgi:hypothetical protein
MTLNKEREEYNLVSYKELEKIFIQCEKNSQLNKEISIDKNIEINSQIKLPVINFMNSKNKIKDIVKRKLKKFSCS